MTDSQKTVKRLRELASIINYKRIASIMAELAIVVADALERSARDDAYWNAEVNALTQRITELESENARLARLTECDSCGKSFDENGGVCEPCHSSAVHSHIKPLGKRIRELEAERDGLAKENAFLRAAKPSSPHPAAQPEGREQ